MRASANALDQAIAAFRDPSLVAELRERSLADEVILVLRVAAGDKAAIAQAQQRTSDSGEQLQEAAVFYLQQALFTPHANAYRVLGCREDAAQQRLRENYRWLIKWLHPDRNVDQWESVYADKVNIAWQALKTPDRRDRYNASNGIDGLAIESPAGGLAVQGKAPSVAVDDRLRLSGSAVRHLPAITLSIMGLGAAVVLGLIYWANQNDAPAPMLSTAAIAPPIDAQLPGRGTAITMDPDPTGMQSMAVTLDQQQLTVAEVLKPSDDAVAEAVATAAETDEARSERAVAPIPEAVVPESAATVAMASNDLPPSPVGGETGSIPDVPGDAQAVDSPVAEAARDLAATGPQADSRPEPTPRLRPAASRPTANVAAASVPPAPLQVSTATRPEVAAAPGASTKPEPMAAQRIAAPTRPSGLAKPTTTADARSITAADTRSSNVPRLNAPSASQAAAIVSDFTAAYTAGDLRRFDGLFSPAAAIPADLGGLRERMRDAQMRYLELANLRWEMEEEAAVGYADYRETFVPEGERRAVTRVGGVQWVIRMNGSQPRIAALNMQSRQN